MPAAAFFAYPPPPRPMGAVQLGLIRFSSADTSAISDATPVPTPTDRFTATSDTPKPEAAPSTEPTMPKKPPSVMGRVATSMINGYQWVTQNTIYPVLSKLGLDVCLHRKAGLYSCSEYTKLAVQEYGPVKGSWYGLKRLADCNPVMVAGTQFFGWQIYDPAEVHGNYADARKERPQWLDNLKDGLFYMKHPLFDQNYDAVNGTPRSIVKPSA